MLSTERLLIREFTELDAPVILELLNSPLYIKNIGDRNVRTLAEAEGFVSDRIMASYAQHGYGMYAVVLIDTNVVVGMCGLVNRDILPHVDIGFGFLPDYMGQGYAYESAKAVKKYAEVELGLSPLLGVTDKKNTPSIKLLRKLGLVHEKIFIWPEDNEEVLLLSTEPH